MGGGGGCRGRWSRRCCGEAQLQWFDILSLLLVPRGVQGARGVGISRAPARIDGSSPSPHVLGFRCSGRSVYLPTGSRLPAACPVAGSSCLLSPPP